MKLGLMKITALTFIATSTAVFAQVDFATFDQNRDSVITDDEYLNVILAPFDRIDTDSNGWLSEPELMVVARQRAEGTQRKPRRMVNRVFERFDSNEDRRLTALELGFGGSGEFFNRYDGNFDGAITLAEWQSRTQPPAGSGTTVDGAEDGEDGSEPEATAEGTSSTTRPDRPRVPTEPTEPATDNTWKMDQTPDITGVQPMTGSWLFDLRP